MKNKSTHILFDGKKIVISSDLRIIIDFLQEIEKEIESFINFENKLDAIRKQHQETLGVTLKLIKKLNENSIDFNETVSEDPATMADKLKIHRPLRSEMIVLFSNLEVLLCLNIAYENKTTDKGIIISKAMNKSVVQSFYNNFCLNDENNWIKQNPERSQHIKAENLRDMRNSLTHFFSVSEAISIGDPVLDKKSRELEKKTNHKVNFLSSPELYEIIKGAAILLIKKWSTDCIDCINQKSTDFKKRILCVNKLVEEHGARMLKVSK